MVIERALSPLLLPASLATMLALAVMADAVDAQPARQEERADSSLVRRLQEASKADPLFTIGSLDGDPSYVFGRVSHLAVDDEENLYVLDLHTLNVRSYDQTGRFVHEFGRSGGGPGEFRSFSGIAVRDTSVAILDLRNSRISEYGISPRGVHHVRDVRVEGSAYDLCWGRYHFVLSTPQQDSMLRLVTPAGDVVHDFGDPLPMGPPREGGEGADWSRIDANRGHLLCLRDKGIVILAHSVKPWIRAFAEGGARAWRSRLSDYSELRYAEVKGRPGALTPAPDPETGKVTSLISVFPVGQNLIAVVLSDAPIGRFADTDYEVRVLSIDSGREVARFRTPYAIQAASATRLYAYRSDPFPAVLVLAVPQH